MRPFIHILSLLSLWLLSAGEAHADKWLLSVSGGREPGVDQDNFMAAIDYEFAERPRSQRSALSFGVSYANIRNNAAEGAGEAHVLTLYPQLTLYPVRESMRNTYFFVRALGPGYLSENHFGHLQQSNNFTFLAQVGVGYRMPLDGASSLLWQLSWRHYSNAGLFSANDGIDFPVTLSVGMRY